MGKLVMTLWNRCNDILQKIQVYQITIFFDLAQCQCL